MLVLNQIIFSAEYLLTLMSVVGIFQNEWFVKNTKNKNKKW